MRTWILRLRTADNALFDQLRIGKKRIETRAGTPKYRKVAVGDSLTFVCGTKRLTKHVKSVQHFASIEAMLKKLPLRAIMPSAKTALAAKRMYAAWPGYIEKIKKGGIVAWRII